jgi:surface protein
MFSKCFELTTLDLSNWDISNVTDMSYMFYYSNRLIELKMGGNPNNLTNVGSMFLTVDTNGSFYYNSAYDYSKILSVLPSRWTAIPCTLVDGVLVPNE